MSPSSEVTAHARDIDACRPHLPPATVMCFTPETAATMRIRGVIKYVSFVRHGEGEHNRRAALAGGCHCATGNCPYNSPDLIDSLLVSTGQEQADALAPVTKDMTIDAVFVSPLRRTLETALRAFASTPRTFIAVESCREMSGKHTCDMRRKRSEQERDYPQVDFSLIEEDDTLFTPHEREPRLSVAQRSRAFLSFLKDRPESSVGVVTHSAWLFTTFRLNLKLEKEEQMGKWFETGEMRTFALVWPEEE